MYDNDALLLHTREAARKIMAAVAAQPQTERAAVVRTALDAMRPGLFSKVEGMASKIMVKGTTAMAAYEEALHLALADEMVESVQALGKSKLTGRLTNEAMRAQRMFYPADAMSGIGDSGDGLGNVGTDIAKFGESLLRNAACSPAVNTAIMGQVGAGQTSRDITAAGLSVAAGISQCGKLPGQIQPLGPPVAPPVAPPPPKSDTMTYAIAGAALIGIGAIAYLALRKPKAAPMAANRRRRRN